MFIKVCHSEEHNFLRVYWNLATIQNWSRRQKIVGLKKYCWHSMHMRNEKNMNEGEEWKATWSWSLLHVHWRQFAEHSSNWKSIDHLTYYFSYTCFLDTCNLSIHYNLDSTDIKATIFIIVLTAVAYCAQFWEHNTRSYYTRITTLYYTSWFRFFNYHNSWKYWQCFYNGRLAVVTSYRQNLTATNNSFLGVWQYFLIN